MGQKYKLNNRVSADSQCHSVINTSLVTVWIIKKITILHKFADGFPDGQLLCACSG